MNDHTHLLDGDVTTEIDGHRHSVFGNETSWIEGHKHFVKNKKLSLPVRDKKATANTGGCK